MGTSQFTGAGTVLGTNANLKAVHHQSVYHQAPLDAPFNKLYLDKLAQGDDETAAHFASYFTKLLIVQLRFKLRSASLAEDAAQETLFRVLQLARRNEIQFPERLPAFVRSVSENVAREIARKNSHFQQIPENTVEPVARAVSAELNYITRERKEGFMRDLNKLKASDRAVIYKIFIDEQDKDSICAEFGIDRNTLRVRVCRALARLRKAVHPDQQSHPPLQKKAAAS